MLQKNNIVKKNESVSMVQVKVDRSGGVVLDDAWLHQLCMEAGADDVGFVEVGRVGLESECEEARRAFPRAKTFISFVCRVGRENMRTPARSIANAEFHSVGDKVNEVAQHIVHALERKGVGAINPTMGFPMEMDRWPGRIWVVSHKPIAVAAGLGVMGIHRLVIHPKFGNHILLGTVVIEAEVTSRAVPLDFNPCLECKLCVAACPTGAIKPDGEFDFSACYTHNYREFMGGFGDWVENIAESKNRLDYRKKVTDAETVSMWQSLGWGPNYKAAYCMAVCPAGEDVIGPFLENKKGYIKGVLKPLQDKEEDVYVVEGSDAHEYVGKRFKRKSVRVVGSGLRPVDAKGFFEALPWLFQRGQAKGLDCVYHFTIKGERAHLATITISDQRLKVEANHVGKAKVRLIASEAAWIGFVRGERSLIRGLLTFGIIVIGDPRLLLRFGKCFPS